MSPEEARGSPLRHADLPLRREPPATSFGAFPRESRSSGAGPPCVRFLVLFDATLKEGIVHRKK